MEKLTHEEYQHRLSVINKAMALYGEAAGYNINKALEMLNEPDFEISIPAERFKGLTGSEFDAYERPLCPDCGEAMGFRQVPPNDEGVKTQLICLNPNCDTVLDSELTMDQWREVLTKL